MFPSILLLHLMSIRCSPYLIIKHIYSHHLLGPVVQPISWDFPTIPVSASSRPSQPPCRLSGAGSYSCAAASRLISKRTLPTTRYAHPYCKLTLNSNGAIVRFVQRASVHFIIWLRPHTRHGCIRWLLPNMEKIAELQFSM